MPDLLPLHWVVLALIAGVVLVMAFWISEDGPVARRVFAQFLLNIALPLAVILGAVLVLIGVAIDLDERVWAAVVAGVVIASGWLTSAIFAELGRSRDRAERLRDYHKALFAEIGNALASLWKEGSSEAFGAQIVERMRSDEAFVPFVPKSHHDHVYDAVIEDIEALPRQTIDAVVAYYSQIKSIAALEVDLRGDSYRKLSQDRRILIYEDYLGMRKRAFDLGQDALRLITAYSDGGAEAADAKLKELNSPVAGRPSHPRGSE